MKEDIEYDYDRKYGMYDDIKDEIIEDSSEDLDPGYWWSENFRDYMDDSSFPDEYVTVTYPERNVDGAIVEAVEEIMQDYEHYDANWRIEPDGSLGDEGVEIITPPIPVQDMENIIRTFSDFCNSNDFITTEQCGLHMNMSYDNFDIEHLNYMKLACLIGDKHILQKFHRIGNTYAPSSSDNLQKYAKAYLANFDSLQHETIFNQPQR